MCIRDRVEEVKKEEAKQIEELKEKEDKLDKDIREKEKLLEELMSRDEYKQFGFIGLADVKKLSKQKNKMFLVGVEKGTKLRKYENEYTNERQKKEINYEVVIENISRDAIVSLDLDEQEVEIEGVRS
eukprot:TRINITY_DN13332_c0_g1_i2.p1 TRINITY_DN13332_c0_g1~~TRINITY_DN13332_c0_g1_i2.p1  ORF type:complete len:128 (-),score=45.57 TRINITY_DN13332_c0_g1_i2:68-451(-)